MSTFDNSHERHTISQLIAKIGETDQQFLQQATPQLAQQRAALRVQLSQFSHQKNEKVYLLTEAAALLEMAIMALKDSDEDDLALHMRLCVCLAQVYLTFFQVTHQNHYLIICNQILKPHAHHRDADILIALVRTNAAANQPALTRHWLGKLMQHHAQDAMHHLTDQLLHYPELQPFQQEDWFIQLLKPTLLH